MRRYVSRVSNGRGFRSVYPQGGRWRWHTNIAIREVPPREWKNAAGWSRWKSWGIVRAFAADGRLRVERWRNKRQRKKAA